MAQTSRRSKCRRKYRRNLPVACDLGLNQAPTCICKSHKKRASNRVYSETLLANRLQLSRDEKGAAQRDLKGVGGLRQRRPGAVSTPFLTLFLLMFPYVLLTLSSLLADSLLMFPLHFCRLIDAGGDPSHVLLGCARCGDPLQGKSPSCILGSVKRRCVLDIFLRDCCVIQSWRATRRRQRRRCRHTGRSCAGTTRSCRPAERTCPLWWCVHRSLCPSLLPPPCSVRHVHGPERISGSAASIRTDWGRRGPPGEVSAGEAHLLSLHRRLKQDGLECIPTSELLVHHATRQLLVMSRPSLTDRL